MTEKQISFTEAIKICMTKKFATLSGRATRAEFWLFQLFIFLGFILFALIVALFYSIGEEVVGGFFGLMLLIFFIITIIPNICSQVRRLHDGGYPGLFFFFHFIPYIGSFIIIFLHIQVSDDDNEYGPNPSKLNIVNSNTIPQAGFIQESPTKGEVFKEITDVDL